MTHSPRLGERLWGEWTINSPLHSHRKWLFMGSKGKRDNLSISHLVASWLRKAKGQFLIKWSLAPECQQAPRTTKDHVATEAFCKASIVFWWDFLLLLLPFRDLSPLSLLVMWLLSYCDWQLHWTTRVKIRLRWVYFFCPIVRKLF